MQSETTDFKMQLENLRAKFKQKVFFTYYNNFEPVMFFNFNCHELITTCFTGTRLKYWVLYRNTL